MPSILIVTFFAFACGSKAGTDVRGTDGGDSCQATVKDQLAVLATKKTYFGHQSVGAQILAGVSNLIAGNPGTGPAIKAVGQPLTPGTWVENAIGRNTEPLSKIAAFDATVRSGSVPAADIAFMKLCFVDFGASTDPGAIFAQYKATLDKLQADYPATIFVHVTPPLTTGSASWDCDANRIRADFANLLRANYPANRVFDLQAVEAAGPSGLAATCTSSGHVNPALAPEWASSDGAHVSDAGADTLARKLLAFLACLR